MHPPSAASSTDVLTELLPSQNNPGLWERLCTPSLAWPGLSQLQSVQVEVGCHLGGTEWGRFGQNATIPKEMVPSVGNFTSFALAAPKDLTCMDRVSVWHLKVSLRGHNGSLSPGWAVNLEISGSQHPQEAAPAFPAVQSIPGEGGDVGPAHPWHGGRVPSPSLPALLPHTAHVSFFASFP